MLQSHGACNSFTLCAKAKEKISAQTVAKVVEEEFGTKFQAADGKIVFGSNDKKLHSDVSTFFSDKFYLSVSRHRGENLASKFGQELER